MPLTKLQFRPGVNKEITSYSNEGGYFASNLVRFRDGFPEQIGGWIKNSTDQFLGTARALHPFVTLARTTYVGLGTNLKYYLESGGSYTDITPIRETASGLSGPFSASNGDATLTVTDASHGAVANDFVTFSGATALGGNVTAAILNAEHQIATVTDANTYTIELSVTANSSDSGNGGTVTAAYQINTGLDTVVLGSGWGAGTWGSDGWGDASTVSVEAGTLRLWSHDSFGEDLLINVRDGAVYYWDATSPSARAVEIGTVSGASGTPQVAKQILVSDKDRHVIAFGCDSETDPGTQDPLLIRFSDQESFTDWTATSINTAGDLRLGVGTTFVAAVETNRETLVFTDVSLHSMQFIGPPFTFGINQIASNITIMSPNAVIAVNDVVFWMGIEDFYAYGGSTSKLPSTLRSYVFDDLNLLQREKITAGSNSSFGEVWWFYPSSDSDENDRYVVYNYEQRVWYYGSLVRTAWIDRGVEDFPMATGADRYLYLHENGLNDGSNDPATALASSVETSQIDIGDGEQFMFIRRMIPDVTFSGSTEASPAVSFTLETRNFPGANFNETDSNDVTRTATSPVEQFTNQIFVRMRGRSVALKIENSMTGVTWRLGSPRVDLRPDGRR
jgi:hypothetical protein